MKTPPDGCPNCGTPSPDNGEWVLCGDCEDQLEEYQKNIDELDEKCKQMMRDTIEDQLSEVLGEDGMADLQKSQIAIPELVEAVRKDLANGI